MSDLNTLGFDPISLPVLPAMKPLAEPSYGSTLLPPLPKPTTPVQAPLLAPAPPMPSMKPLPPTPPSVKQSPPVEPAKPPVSSSYAWLPEFARSLLKPTRQKGVITTGLVSLVVGAGVLRMVWPPPVPNRAVAEVQVAEPSKAEAPLPAVPITPLLTATIPTIEVPKLDFNVPTHTLTATPAFEFPKMVEWPQVEVKEKQPERVATDEMNAIETWYKQNLRNPNDYIRYVLTWASTMPYDVRIPVPDRARPTLTLVSASEPVITVPAPVTSTAPPSITPPTLDVPKLEVPMLVQTGVTPPTPVAPVLTLPASPMLIAPPLTQPTLDIPAPKPILEVKKPEAKFDSPLPKIDTAPTVLSKIEPVPQALPKIETTPALPKIDIQPTLPEPAKLEPFAAKPVVPSVPAVGETRTDYDVDLHYPKGGGETWASVSKQYLGDDRYGEALKAYNRNAALSQLPRVEIPPIHVLRKKYATLIGQPAVAPEKSNIEWAAAPAARSTSGGYRQYAIPTGGMTMKEVAKAAWGDENMWGKIWDLNPTQRADEAMRAGTKILLPTDAKIGE